MRLIQPCGPNAPMGKMGRDDGMPFYLRKWIPEFGVQYDRVDCTATEAERGEYDGVFYVDWGADAFPGVPDPIPPPDKPSVCWLSDTHYHPRGKAFRFAQAEHYGTVTFVHRDAAEEYGKGSLWVPTAADHTIYAPNMAHTLDPLMCPAPDAESLDRLYVPKVANFDVCFVGHVGSAGRDVFLQQMFDAFPEFTFNPHVFFQAAASVYHRSKIALNRSVRGDLNMRTFEVMASRTFLLTDRQNGMDALGLQDGMHCCIVEQGEDPVEKARYWLDHDREREKVAEAGWRWVLANHTYWHRAQQFIEMFRVRSPALW